MKLRTLILLVLVAVSTVSCGVITRMGEKKIAKNFEIKEQLPAGYYLSEGIKVASLYGDADAATKMINQAIASDSTYAPSYYYLADILADSDSKQALSLAEKACALDSTNLWYKELMGRLLLVNEKYQDALVFYTKLIELTPKEVNNYRILAAIYQQVKQPIKAIEVLDSVEEKFGRIEQFSDFKRQLLLGEGRIEQALTESLAIENENPFNTNNLLTLAELYAAYSRTELAMSYYQKVFEINPTHGAALISLSKFYSSRQDMDEYLECLERIFVSPEITLEHKLYLLKQLTSNKIFYANNYDYIGKLISSLLTLNPKEYTIIELYAQHLLTNKNIDSALDFYKSKLGDKKTQYAIASNIINMESYLNRADSVSKYSAIALENSPKNAELYMNLASSLSYLQKTDEAIKIYEQALNYTETDSLQSVIYGLMGDAYYFHSQKSLSEKYYKKSLDLDKNNALILNNYAYFLVTELDAKKGFKKAVKMAEQATTIVKNSPTFLDTYAWALYKTHDYAKAKKVMQKALSLDNSSSHELLLHYGDILFALEDYFMADTYWRKALDNGADKEQIELRLKQNKDK